VRAPTPARFSFCVCVCACVCAVVRSCAPAWVCVCVCDIRRLYMFYCYCARVCEVCRVVVPVRNFWKIPVVFGASIRRRSVRDFEFRAFGFLSFRPAAARSVAVKFSVVRCFRSLVRTHYFKFCSVCWYRSNAVRGPSDPSTLNIVIINNNNNNNNKYHALRAGVNNRQVGHRASAKKFLLFTERDILRCVYRSAKRSVYTNFMFAFFWTDKMVPGWLGLIDDQLAIAGVSCDVSITWRTAPVDYFICRSYTLSSNLFYRFTV